MQQPEAAGAKVQQRFDNLNYNDIKKGKQLNFLRVSCDILERFRSFVRSRGTETSLFSKNANLQLTRGESCGIIIDVAGNARRATMESAAVAHLVERHLAKVEVAGSSPVIRSIKSVQLMYWFFILQIFLPNKGLEGVALRPPPVAERGSKALSEIRSKRKYIYVQRIATVFQTVNLKIKSVDES